MMILPHPSSQKLLIVDDDAAHMRALCQTLEGEGFTITGFTSSTQAVAALREQTFDVVLSDLMMPEIDGISLLRVALEIDPNIVGIVMTGHGTVDTAVQAMKQGALDYILKPFRLSAVLPVLARGLSIRRLRLENIQLHQAISIYQGSMAIALARGLDDILEMIAEAVLGEIGGEHVSVLLPRSNGKDLYVAVSRGENATTQGTCIPVTDEIAHWTEQGCEFLAHAGELAEFLSTFPVTLPPLPQGIDVPMFSGRSLIGILHFASPPGGRAVTSGQLKTLSVLANTAASTLQRASLLEELHGAEQKYRRLAENAPDVVWRFELQPLCHFVYVSPVVEAITGYSPEEYCADPELSRNVVHPADRHLVEAMWRGEQPSDSFVTLRWLHRNGNVIWIEQKYIVLRDQDSRPIAIEGISRDITQRRALEEQFQQAQKLEGVGRLAAGVAHDFNNLLTVISGNTQMVLDDLRAESPLRSNMEEISSAAERAAALTQQLLAFSRKQLVSPSVLNINTTILDFQKMLQRLIGEDIDFCTNLAPDLGNVLADKGQLQQILMNLTVNARDAMPDGGTLLIQTSNIAMDYTDVVIRDGARLRPHVTLSVSDTGMGMTAAVKEHIFEPFFTTKPQGVGTGLGLSTVYGIVEQAGGWIAVSSEPGQGSTFKIYLPRIDKLLTEVPFLPKTEVRGSETVLVVEDQAEVRRLAVAALQKLGYRAYSASCGAEALSLIRSLSEPIHLLLTDVVMPGMHGRHLADRIKEVFPALRVLFMSGYTDDIIAPRGVLQPGIVCLQKPFTIDSLGEKIQEALGPRGTPKDTSSS